ncbi:hypothetical protein PIECOFPK_02589 [Mycovorax composti]|jgi:hypothetical protein|uniref:Uncharacterized protein n=2 Tax=Chitinophagaceae TaxID=563835 RepID=A0ABZ2EN11_9BACT
MLRLLFIFFSFTIFLGANAQVPDFISVRKKNGVPVKNYYAGIEISLITHDGRRYDALIDRIANDSIFLRYYTLHAYTNIFGTTSYDTITTYTLGMHYKNIKTILVPKISYRDHYLATLGRFAAIGGFGYDFLNIFNGLVQKHDPLFDKRNTRNVAIATGVGAAGLFLNRKYRRPGNSSKYKIVYVNLSQSTP